MWWQAVAQIGASLLGGGLASGSARDATNEQVRAGREALDFQRESRDIALELLAPQTQASNVALDRMLGMTGLQRPTALQNALGEAGVVEAPPAPAYEGGFRGSPLSQSDFQVLEKAWPTIREAAYFGDINWRALGFDKNPLSRQAQEAVGSSWGDIRSAARLGDINWQAHGFSPDSLSAATSQGNAQTPPAQPPTSAGRLMEGSFDQTEQGRTRSSEIGPIAPPPKINPAHAAEGIFPAGVSADDVPQQGGTSISDDPSYQFRLDEGMRALENSAAARGGLMSGGFARRALRYAQDYASNEYTNIFNRIASIAGMNQTTNQANAALNFGSNAANIAMNSGDARASGYIAQGNAWQNTMDQIALALGRGFGQGGNSPVVGSSASGGVPLYNVRAA